MDLVHPVEEDEEVLVECGVSYVLRQVQEASALRVLPDTLDLGAGEPHLDAVDQSHGGPREWKRC